MADVVAARQLAAAITRLDLVVARLAVGGCRIDRSVAALTGEPPAQPSPAQPTSDDNDADHHSRASHDNEADHDSDRVGDAGSAEVIARGSRAASALVTRRHRLTGPRTHRRALTMIRERRW
ncbi:hypothetical protein KBX71_21870 [Micromonospora sp. D93]|uniref:hypothetical protein n=1 Tax=Micromonospora sp. D93 TaxID=2824886 RepID=UPI001B378FE3|nr:hypothetical protein [Micromonospora sp. D93]MBQ1020502.1 hypothetical protein [Micromonospora sp. D93]